MNYIAMAKKDSAQLDYLLAGSQKSREIFERAFWYNGVIINPRRNVIYSLQRKRQFKVKSFTILIFLKRAILYFTLPHFVRTTILQFMI